MPRPVNRKAKFVFLNISRHLEQPRQDCLFLDGINVSGGVNLALDSSPCRVLFFFSL